MPKLLYRAKIAGQASIDIYPTTLAEIDVRYTEAGVPYEAFVKGKKIPLTVIENTEEQMGYYVFIGGCAHEIKLQRPVDIVVEEMGYISAADIGEEQILAPMPGRIVKILVSPGEVVEQGQTLLTLEAMKMENAVKAQISGTVKILAVDTDATVIKGQLLVELEH